MKQSRAASLTESLLNVGIGFSISLGAQIVFLPLLGVAINHAQNFAFALIMTVISIARSYGVRRLFEALHIRRPLSPFMQAVIAERERQIGAEGFGASYDDALPPGMLNNMGAAYLLNAGQPRVAPDFWDGGDDWWKPGGVRRDLVRGCALGIAAGEKFDRARHANTRVTGGGIAPAHWPKPASRSGAEPQGTHP